MASCRGVSVVICVDSLRFFDCFVDGLRAASCCVTECNFTAHQNITTRSYHLEKEGDGDRTSLLKMICECLKWLATTWCIKTGLKRLIVFYLGTFYRF